MGIRSLSTSSIKTGVRRNRMWDQNISFGSDFYQIATTTVGGGGTSSITFSSVPQIYTHLQVRAIGRYTDAGTGSEAVNMRFNSDSTYTNYRTHLLYGTGTGIASLTDQQVTYAGISLADFWKGGTLASAYGCIIYDILDYTNTNKHKTVRYINGFNDNDSTGGIRLGSGVWLNSSAISTITFTPANSLNFAQYTQFALYGIK